MPDGPRLAAASVDQRHGVADINGADDRAAVGMQAQGTSFSEREAFNAGAGFATQKEQNFSRRSTRQRQCASTRLNDGASAVVRFSRAGRLDARASHRVRGSFPERRWSRRRHPRRGAVSAASGYWLAIYTRASMLSQAYFGHSTLRCRSDRGSARASQGAQRSAVAGTDYGAFLRRRDNGMKFGKNAVAS